MDGISALLDGPRARGAFLLRLVLDPPWSLRVQDEAPLTVFACVTGEAHLLPDDDDPVPLGPGDLAIVRGPEPYGVADLPGREPQVIVHPGSQCEPVDATALDAPTTLGVRTWGNARDGGAATTMLVGTYQLDGEVSRRVLDALPQRIVLRDGDWDCPLIGLLASEIVKDDPGQDAVLDRLLDLLLVAALRAWLARPEAQAPDWYRASADPEVGHALRLMHADPARAWTVAMLAHEIGVSRASLARRFQALVGQPPMTYLTEWRMALAADLLLEPGATIASVAAQVGYGSPFALSAAFKRARGVSPREHRRAGPAPPVAAAV